MRALFGDQLCRSSGALSKLNLTSAHREGPVAAVPFCLLCSVLCCVCASVAGSRSDPNPRPLPGCRQPRAGSHRAHGGAHQPLQVRAQRHTAHTSHSGPPAVAGVGHRFAQMGDASNHTPAPLLPAVLFVAARGRRPPRGEQAPAAAAVAAALGPLLHVKQSAGAFDTHRTDASGCACCGGPQDGTAQQVAAPRPPLPPVADGCFSLHLCLL